MAQKVEVREGRYEPGDKNTPPNLTVAKPVDISDKPGKIVVGDKTLHARLTATTGAQYNTLCGISEEHIVQVNHDIDESDATLAVQRLVRAVLVKGGGFQTTQGQYMSYGPVSKVPKGNDIKSLTASQLLSAQWQPDGPKSLSDVKLNDMSFVIRDSPGIASSMPFHFPFALRAQFILRITVEFTAQTPQMADFHYSTYFEFLKDPFPQGFRGAKFIPVNSRNDPYLTFQAIERRYLQDSTKNQQKPAPKGCIKCGNEKRPLDPNGLCFTCSLVG